MQIKQLGVCRSKNRNIYEKLEIVVPEAAKHLQLAVPVPGQDDAVPARLFTMDPQSSKPSGQYVLVVPLLDGHTSATVVLNAYDAEGQIVDQATHTIDYEAVRLQSRKNRIINKALLAEIECYDEKHPECVIKDIIDVTLIRALPTDTHMICEFKVTLPYTDPANITISAFNQNFESLGEIIDMGTSKLANNIAPGNTDICCSRSVCVPWDQQVVYITVTDAAHPHLQTTRFLMRSELDASAAAMEAIFRDAACDPFYAEWFEGHRITENELLRQSATHLAWEPKFSIIVPLYKTPSTFFTEMLASVTKQSYANWELILVNASPEMPELAKLVSDACERDARVRCVTLEENLGISLNTNAGIEVATGDFVAFMDHDDVIELNLFYEYAKALNRDNAIDLLYCDEDKLWPDGVYRDVLFKPKFNIDMLRSGNYICHLLAIRKSLLDTLEPNTKEFDGAQDHNLILEAVEKTSHIEHIAKVLYHWRVSETSAASNNQEKDYANDAGIKAVSAHLERLGIPAEVGPSGHSLLYSVRYLPPAENPLVSIIIPTYEHADMLARCLNSILEKSTYTNFEIVLIENNSKNPETFAYYDEICAKDSRVRVVTYDGPFNFSKIVNFGVTHAKGDYYLLLNNDTEVITPDWLERLVGICSRKDVGCAGVRLYFPNDTIQHAGVILYTPLAMHLFVHTPRSRCGYFAKWQRDLSAVTAACLMTTRENWDLVSGFSEDFTVGYNDVDFCLKLGKAGKLVVYVPEVELYHYESLSRGSDQSGSNLTRYFSEVGRLMERYSEIYAQSDPYFTPNIRPGYPEAASYYHF